MNEAGAYGPRDLSESSLLVAPDLVHLTLSEALRNGGELAELFVEEREGTTAVLDNGKIEELVSSRDGGAGVRVIVGESTGYAYTARLDQGSLVAAAQAAAAIAVTGGGRTDVKVGGHAPHVGRVLVAPAGVDKAAKIDLLRLGDGAARESGSSITQVSVSYGDSRRRTQIANSDGVFTSDDVVRTRWSISCVASGDTGRQSGYETLARTAGFEVFDERDVRALAVVAANRAILKLSARPAPRGRLPVVLAAGTGGIMFHEACGHGLEADHIVKDTSVYRGKIGELVASPLVTLIDDGTVDSEWGTQAVDDEGNPTQRNVLIEAGVLCDYMWDWVRARGRSKSKSSNGRRQSYRHLPMVRMTNTFIPNGNSNPEDIISSTSRGVFVAKLGGGQVNTTTGDFVFGATEAYLIENGQITAPLRDVNLIGNGPEVLKLIDAVGNDFEMGPGTCGKDGQSVAVGFGQPTLRIGSMTVGGTSDA